MEDADRVVSRLSIAPMRLFEGTPFDIPPKCDRCGKLEADCDCPPLPPPKVAPEKQTARVAVEKRKRGKIVTVIRGLVNDQHLEELLTALKSACGAGGTVKDGEVGIQGDHFSRIQQLLRDRGFRVKP
jgi:translation initiation factor 1